MDRIPRKSDLTAEEFASLRIISRGYTTRASIPVPHIKRLVELGLAQAGMGGLMPTPAGRIVSRAF